jgi:hypothetical protein
MMTLRHHDALSRGCVEAGTNRKKEEPYDYDMVYLETIFTPQSTILEVFQHLEPVLNTTHVRPTTRKKTIWNRSPEM